jgi:hypothetical protein
MLGRHFFNYCAVHRCISGLEIKPLDFKVEEYVHRCISGLES